MLKFRFNNVYLQALAVNLPSHEVTSAELEDRLAPVYERLKIPFGTLEKLSGVKSRYLWPVDVLPSHAATAAVKTALEQTHFGVDSIDAIFNCSVTRDYFEPATATLVHRNIGLPQSAMAMDITNACVGFSNGILMMSNLIESGVCRAGIVVSGETVAAIQESSIKHLLEKEDLTREEMIKILPTFTLGSGAVAYVLCHKSMAHNGHRIIGSVTQSATQFNDLCSGNADYQLGGPEEFTAIMYTEASKIISSASRLGGEVFKDFSQAFGWSKDDIDHIFCHQVGKQVNEGFYDEMGLDIEKEFTIYRKYGNLVSAALPSALTIGAEEKGIKTGEKVLLTAFGSGLNAIFTGIEW